MAEQVLTYRSRDGNTYHRREDAEEHDKFLEVLGELYAIAGPQYSPGYDGPMPSWKPDAECLFRHRRLLRNMLLELPEPEPRIVRQVEDRLVYRFPHWMVPLSIFLAGLALGLLQ